MTPSTTNPVLVHKQDAEGSITIDRLTGQIISPADERPDWAEDLMIAQTAARDVFYINALGPNYTEDRQAPEVLAFEDLDWLCAREYPDQPLINENGEQEDHELFAMEADPDFRSEQVAAALGLTAELDEHGNQTGSWEGALAEAEVRHDEHRTEAEVAELEAEQATGFASTGS